MLRNLIVLPDGSEIFSGAGTTNAIASTTLTEYTNRETELTLGSVCSSSLELKIIAPGGKLNISEGSEITHYRVDEAGTRKKVGIFITEKPTKSSANTYKVSAYDRIARLDKDLTEWLQTLDGWPYSLYDFANMVCNACGLTLKNTEIPNGDYLIQRFNASGITGRQFMQKIGEACCRFGRATPDGEFEFAWYEDTGKEITVSDYYQGGLSYEDYSTHPIEKVQIKQTDSDVGVIWPNNPEALNTYVIGGNYLLTANATEDLQSVAKRIYEELQGITYTPCKCVLQAAVGIKSGEIVRITDLNGTTIKALVMSKRQMGQKDTVECYGSHRRDSVTHVNNQTFTEVLVGKVYELETSVEGLKATNRDLDGRVTQIKQDTQDIILTALRDYATTGDLEEYKGTIAAQLAVMADQITITVGQGLAKDIEVGNTALQEQINEIKANYRFTADGQYIGKTDSDIMLRLVNDIVQFLVAGAATTTIDRYGMNADQVNIKTLHMGDYTLSLGTDGHLTLS